MIAIVSALEMELEPFVNVLEEAQVTYISGLRFLIGKIKGVKVVLSLLGIGKVNSAYGTGVLVSNFDLNLILFSGVSAGLKNVKELETVIALSCVLHDCDATAGGYPRGYVFGLNTVNMDCSSEAVTIFKKALPSAKLGVIASGDKFIASKEDADFLEKTFNAIAVDMESASVAQASEIAKIPFVAIRTASDSGRGSAFGDYKKNAPTASKLSAKAVLEALAELGAHFKKHM
ncbi:MAG: 5'-methylthioadenosine/adenosylhomocysteine nucleosidase [Firmicutes bacterium]|nr:5'-methylthioadenosine/adenosylhomocysteine nucleosidase [Bacillota bacterium]